MLRSVHWGVFLVCVACAGYCEAGYVILIDDYTQIADASFRNLPNSSAAALLAPWTVGDLTITCTHAGNPGVFAQGSVSGPPSDPGNGSGFSMRSPVTLDFSVPLAAFGVTFNRWGAVHPATLEVFDGPGGTGNLLGSISSAAYSYPVSQENPPQDFVGIWSSEVNIRSAVMYGSGSEKKYEGDGYGFSFTAVPEPGVIVAVLLCGLASLVLWRGRR